MCMFEYVVTQFMYVCIIYVYVCMHLFFVLFTFHTFKYVYYARLSGTSKIGLVSFYHTTRERQKSFDISDNGNRSKQERKRYSNQRVRAKEREADNTI